MTEELKEEIIKEVATRHKILLDKNDPVFAILTANELVIGSFLKAVELKEQKHFSNIEGMTSKFIADAKELAEIKIGSAVNETYKILEKKQSIAIEQIEAAARAASESFSEAVQTIKVNYFIVSGSIVASMLFGFMLGKLF